MAEYSKEEMEEILEYGIKTRNIKTIKAVVTVAVLDGLMSKIDDLIIYRALLCLCMPSKKGRPSKKNEDVKLFKHYCSMACKIKAEVNRLNGNKPDTFSGVWDDFNSSMARPKKEELELWRCAGWFKYLSNEKLGKQVLKRFKLSMEDVELFAIKNNKI